MDLAALLQTFGFPVALAVALVYWWRKDYADLVKRVRQVEESRASELRAYANSYKVLAEQVTGALEQNNRVTRQLISMMGERTWERTTDRHDTPTPRPDRHRTPLPFGVDPDAPEAKGSNGP
jgi:hypothetical protein